MPRRPQLTRRSLVLTGAATALLVACAPDLEQAEADADFAGEGVPVPTDHVGYRDVVIAEGMGSEQGEGEFPRTVQHVAGTTEIPAEPLRVVTVSGGQLDAALSLGIVPVGSSNAKAANTVPGYLEPTVLELGSAARDIASIGQRTEPQLEAIAALEPDLILGNLSGLEELYEDLSAIAPTVFTEGAPDNWREDYLLLASALGRQEQAEANLEELAQRSEQIAAEHAPDSTTVSLIRVQEDRIRSMGCLATAGMVMAEIGFLRPATAPADAVSEDVSLENLDQADGDLLIHGSLGGSGESSDGGGGDELERLSAVRRGMASAVDDEIWFQNAGYLASSLILDETAEILAAAAR